MILPQKNIEIGKYWTHSVTLVDGCDRVSPGCDHCWAIPLNERHEVFAGGEGEVVFHYEWIEKLMTTRRAKPRVYAIWNDLFHERVTRQDQLRTLAVMAYQRHIYMVLTKRADRMRTFVNGNVIFGDLLDGNIWLGVTAENQEWANKRIPPLVETRAAKRFVSIEPILGSVDLRLKRWVCTQCGDWTPTEALDDGHHCQCDFYVEERCKNELDWVIVGCETGPGARIDDYTTSHIADVVRQCRGSRVPCWVKALPVHKKGKWRPSHNMDEWPEFLRVREAPV